MTAIQSHGSMIIQIWVLRLTLGSHIIKQLQH
jgi:hypothetical protein